MLIEHGMTINRQRPNIANMKVFGLLLCCSSRWHPSSACHDDVYDDDDGNDDDDQHEHKHDHETSGVLLAATF